jgi:hypothetical protein
MLLFLLKRNQRLDRAKVKNDHLTLNPQAPVWSTEGFDTKDLQDAKALIEELSD